MAKKPKNPRIDRFWEFWAEWEITRGKFIFTLVLIVSILIIDRLILQTSFNRLSNAVEYQAKHRIMYGIANSDGVFASVDERPEEMVTNYAEVIINNLYSYDKYSAQRNFEDVLKKYDARITESIKPKLQKRLQDINRDGLSSLYIRSSARLVDNKSEYRYITEGINYEYAERIEIGKKKIRVTVVLAKVPPTTVRYAGLTLLEVKEEPL